MSSREEVERFLEEFKVKMQVFDILFRDDRQKNTKTLLLLDITPQKRKEIIKDIQVEDYCEGPLDDRLYGMASMWVFGKMVKGAEIYIKISMGAYVTRVICISFHIAEFTMNYPFRK